MSKQDIPRKVVLGFMPQFEAPILAGIKRLTLRKPRKMRARPGDIAVGYVGLRTKDCRPLFYEDLLFAGQIFLSDTCYDLPLKTNEGFSSKVFIDLLSAPGQHLAILDGFTSWQAMLEKQRELDNIGQWLDVYVWQELNPKTPTND